MFLAEMLKSLDTPLLTLIIFLQFFLYTKIQQICVKVDLVKKEMDKLKNADEQMRIELAAVKQT